MKQQTHYVGDDCSGGHKEDGVSAALAEMNVAAYSLSAELYDGIERATARLVARAEKAEADAARYELALRGFVCTGAHGGDLSYHCDYVSCNTARQALAPKQKESE